MADAASILAGPAAAKGRAVLFSEMTPPPGAEAAFNDWNDNHDMPGHVRGVPGIVSAMRYKSEVGPHYLAVYELNSSAIPQSAEYRGSKFRPDEPTRRMLESISGFTRYIGEEAFCRAREDGAVTALDAPVLWCVFLSVPLEAINSFANWFDRDHAPRLLEDSNWLMVRRFDTVEYDPEPYSQMILHYLADERALDGAARIDAENTDACRRLAAQRWFQPHGVVYHRRRQRFLKGA